MKLVLFFLLIGLISIEVTPTDAKEVKVKQKNLRRLMMSRFDEKSGEFVLEKNGPDLSRGEYVHDVEVAPNGQFYFLTTEGVSVLKDQNSQLNRLYKIDQFATRDLNDLFIDGEGHIYIASSKGVYVSRDQGKSFSLMQAQGLLKEHFNSVLVDSQKNYFLATESGLLVSLDRGKSFKKVLIAPDKSSSNYNHIYHCFMSGQGILACTSWHGVYVFDRRTESFRPQTPIGSASSSQIDFDSKGRLYGVEQNSIFRSDANHSKFSSLKEEWGLKDIVISNCFVDSKDRLFAYSYKDFLIKNIEGVEKVRALKIPGPFGQLNDVSRLIETKDGGLYLVSWMFPFADLED